MWTGAAGKCVRIQQRRCQRNCALQAGKGRTGWSASESHLHGTQAITTGEYSRSSRLSFLPASSPGLPTAGTSRIYCQRTCPYF